MKNIRKFEQKFNKDCIECVRKAPKSLDNNKNCFQK